VIYVDSSLLLTIYLSQPSGPAARAVLVLPEPKVSSWLLAIEVPLVLRRVLGARPRDRRLLDAALRACDADCRALALYDGLPDVADRVRSDDRFAACRALDAVHLATALLLREESGHAVRLATFDDRLRRAAAVFGLPAIP
jgi:predicted nucleic acid-binding protein